ncbi:MAG: prephenate dehydrogenase [Eubacteriales bacterium]|nr:prephenate dehydrogenase [Clostridiales bacterium]MDY3761179.1 prephenate dehydrogenase [Eubacteriales bacterium]
MNFDKDTKILIVGLGLIGGSYAQGLSEAGFEVGAIDRKQTSIDFALEHGFIKHGRTDADPDYIKDFDLLVFALYPHIFINWIKENQQYIKSGALLTDVTGVKSGLAEEIQSVLRPDLEFIGAHPMAGREVSGVENADSKIFVGANYIVTPTEKNSKEAIGVCKRLGKVLGFKMISELTPEKHDEMIGFLSQMTHCIAISLMVCKDAAEMAEYTGDSFRDLTRIAKINDEMWSELFLINKKELVAQMELFEKHFEKLKKSIEDGDRETMREMMRLSTARRKFFDDFGKKEI